MEEALRPISCIRYEKVTYPATVARIVGQAFALGIPEDAELEVHTEYSSDGPGVFFRWYEKQPRGRQRK